ncbi:type VI secretion system-associated protein TagF [Mesorhizobium retamae]|uniref:Type VI secretion system-associated protein TagF n=1 Tax=Mesorhizobium retamae TaxID=2912854 RepID=A0ABS9Q9F0_9HYPH|nr:type VI secretion system-associated protein TagF [Mesorhizobium sp. IRAMC:0171]MCG7504038.1 type VI secretion system-associated protein TagF [Mesorhizobium sp. IRAMC:0171]
MAALRLVRLGYFGKVPSNGDFVSRNVDRSLRELVDGWMQQGMEESRRVLGDDWLQSFLTAPVWRFVIGSGGSVAFGIKIPSVDRIGRYFPFAILGELAEPALDASTLSRLDKMLDRLEPLLLSALDDDFDLDHFGYRLVDFQKRELAGKASANLLISEILPETEFRNLDEVLAGLDWNDASVWWTRGSTYRQAEIFSLHGLPAPTAFAGLLRDRNVFADLEKIWMEVRDLALTQSDNGQIELAGRHGGLQPYLICHPGNASGHNTSFGAIDPFRNSLIISDGRFATAFQAMVSRLVCRVLPGLWDYEAATLDEEELDKLASFLSAKTSSQKVNILPDFSFAALFQDGVFPGRVYLVCAGDYFCGRIRGAEMALLLSNDAMGDDGTVRRLLDGKCLVLPIDLLPDDRLLVANVAFRRPDLLAELGEVLVQVSAPSELAHAALELALLRGTRGNLAIGCMGGG